MKKLLFHDFQKDTNNVSCFRIKCNSALLIHKYCIDIKIKEATTIFCLLINKPLFITNNN